VRKWAWLLVFLLAACQPKHGEPLKAKVRFVPEHPTVGKAEICIEVDPRMEFSRVTVVGDMTHPGMIPVKAEAHPAGPGLWRVDAFDFNMRGDWVLTITAYDKNGKKYEKEVRLTVP
jgi:hypothetical protein